MIVKPKRQGACGQRFAVTVLPDVLRRCGRERTATHENQAAGTQSNLGASAQSGEMPMPATTYDAPSDAPFGASPLSMGTGWGRQGAPGKKRERRGRLLGAVGVGERSMTPPFLVVQVSQSPAVEGSPTPQHKQRLIVLQLVDSGKPGHGRSDLLRALSQRHVRPRAARRCAQPFHAEHLPIRRERLCSRRGWPGAKIGGPPYGGVRGHRRRRRTGWWRSASATRCRRWTRWKTRIGAAITCCNTSSGTRRRSWRRRD